MPDMEKVIKELESMRDYHRFAGNTITADIACDALALLKEQEAILQKMWNALYAEEDKLENKYVGTDEHYAWFTVYRPWLQRGFEIAVGVIAEQDPHLMTVDELEALPVGAVVWEEYRDAEWGIDKTELEPAMKTGNGNLTGMSGYTTIMEGMGDPDVDGNTWRWWSSKPTEEQRKAVRWDNI